MKKYEIKKAQAEVKRINEIAEGCTSYSEAPELIKSFDNLEDAKLELAKYCTDVKELGTYWLVTEYYIEEAEYDEDEEWIDGGDIWEFSKISARVFDRNAYEDVATFNNVEEAIEYIKNQEDKDIVIKF